MQQAVAHHIVLCCCFLVAFMVEMVWARLACVPMFDVVFVAPTIIVVVKIFVRGLHGRNASSAAVIVLQLECHMALSHLSQQGADDVYFTLV